MKISTKTGDNGESSLHRGARARKSEGIFDLLGDLDELSALIGMCGGEPEGDADRDLLKKIQRDLRRIMGGEMVAVDDLEKEIEKLEREISRKEFVLPEGWLHVARTVCRRAERGYWKWRDKGGEGLDESVGIYLNRLSDLLFLLAEKC
jgi:cob(I)alamin adenosyltransferase